METKINPAQVVGSLLLLALVGLLSGELLGALGAQPCSVRVEPTCYPWGAEGPVAGVWSYASKANYLVRGFAQLAILIVAGSYLIRRAAIDGALSGTERAGLILAAGTFLLLSFV